MPISANVTNRPITASVGETQIDVSVGSPQVTASVSGGFGPSGVQGSSGVVTVSAPVTNSGTSSAANIGLAVGAGLSTVGGALVVSYGTTAGTACQGNDARLSDARTPLSHTHTASQITDFTTAVIAAAPPTTNASLLTSGTLPDARLSANIARTTDVSSAVAALVNSAPATLDTLAELASALGSDANFSTTVTNSLSAKAPINNPTFTGTVGGVTKSMVGLGNVDNTSDANKPISTATQTALNGKAASSHNHDASAINAGTLSADRLPLASANTRGAVRIGTGVAIDGDGVISVSIPSTDWTAISNKPSTFPPESHAASHAAGGADELFDQSLGTEDAPAFAGLSLPYFSATDYTVGAEGVRFEWSEGLFLGPAPPGTGTSNYAIGSFGNPAFDDRQINFQTGGFSGPWDFAGATVSGLSYDDLDNLPTLFDGAYSSLSGLPTLGTAAAASTSDFASASHNHSASAITSGTFDAARLPLATTTTAGAVIVGTGLGVSSGTVSANVTSVAGRTGAVTIAAADVSGLGGAATLNVGTTAGTVAAGDHTHSQLHDRSHAITSSSDHTATNWRLFHSNGSGQVVELAFGNSGQALISQGASAAPTWGQAGSTSASDLTSGTLANARMTTRARAAMNLYLWSAFR